MTATRNLSISTGSFYPESTERSIINAQRLGFGSVELVIQGSEINYNFYRQIRMDYYRRLGRSFRKYNIAAETVHAPFLQGADVFSAASRMQILEFSLEITRIVEGDALVLHPYHIFSSHEGAVRFFSSGSNRVEDFLLPKFVSFVKKSESSNVVLLVENVGHWYDHPLTNKPQNMINLVKALDSDFVGSVIDLFHSEFADETLSFTKKLDESIVAVHMSDISATKERVLPGRGKIDWRRVSDLINRLPRLRHKVLEGPSGSRSADVAKSADFLEPLLS